MKSTPGASTGGPFCLTVVLALSTPLSPVFWQMGWQPIGFAGKNAGELLPTGTAAIWKHTPSGNASWQVVYNGGPLYRTPPQTKKTEKSVGQI